MSTAGPRVVLHIGAPKTGTSYLQSVLWKNQRALAAAGVNVPGEARRVHFRAMLDLREASFKGHRAADVEGAWPRLVDRVRGWGGTSVLDCELFARASAEQVDRALRDLDFAQVHVVYTSRDLARQLPAAWQEWIKHREAVPFADYLARVREHADREGPAHQGRDFFWSAQHGPEVLERWSRGLPRERVHVVPVPPSGADQSLLWKRFAGLLGVDPDAYDTDVARANESLGAVQAATLRRLNEDPRIRALPWPTYAAVVKRGLVRTLAREKDTRIELPAEVYDWAVDWSRRTVDTLAEAGYDVVGDLEELVPGPRVTGRDPDAVSAAEVRDAAVRCTAALVQQRARRRRRAAPATSPAPAGLRARVRRQLVRLAGRSRAAAALHGQYRRVRGAR